MPSLTDPNALFAFFIVFVRCGAAFVASPLFGAISTPVQVRIFVAAALSAAISISISPSIGAAPEHLGGLILALANEVAAGLLIGLLFQFVIQVAAMAGAFLDLQIGLSMSQTMNPATGIPVSVIGQFKTMLATVVFLSLSGHHWILQAITDSYIAAPTLTQADLGLLHRGVLQLLGKGCLIAIQIAAPVLGVTMIVDAALGVISKALPQFQPIQIGMPAKLAIGISSVSLALPALVTATHTGVQQSFELIARVFAN